MLSHPDLDSSSHFINPSWQHSFQHTQLDPGCSPSEGLPLMSVWLVLVIVHLVLWWNMINGTTFERQLIVSHELAMHGIAPKVNALNTKSHCRHKSGSRANHWAGYTMNCTLGPHSAWDTRRMKRSSPRRERLLHIASPGGRILPRLPKRPGGILRRLTSDTSNVFLLSMDGQPMLPQVRGSPLVKSSSMHALPVSVTALHSHQKSTLHGTKNPDTPSPNRPSLVHTFSGSPHPQCGSHIHDHGPEILGWE